MNLYSQNANAQPTQNSVQGVFSRTAREILENQDALTSKDVLDKYIEGYVRNIEQSFILQDLKTSHVSIIDSIKNSLATELTLRLISEIKQNKESGDAKKGIFYNMLTSLGLIHLTRDAFYTNFAANL